MQHRKTALFLAGIPATCLLLFVVFWFGYKLEYRRGGLPEISVTARGAADGDLLLTYWENVRGVDIGGDDGRIVRKREDGTTAIGRIANCSLRDGLCTSSPSQKLETLYVGEGEQAVEVWLMGQSAAKNARVAQLRWVGGSHPRKVKLDCDFTQARETACRLLPS
jgi:hypothetical protein